VGGARGSQQYRTKAEAEQAARAQLLASGGGELIVKGKDGKVRDQTTVGKVDAHKAGASPKGAEPHKGAEPPINGHVDRDPGRHNPEG
jgi:uncharacterized protein DUF2188